MSDRCFAHRGLHDRSQGIPENSLAAFSQAIKSGYGIELDVQLSADGVAMVFHDSHLDHLTNGSGRIEKYSSSALQELALDGTDQVIPRFDQVLQLVDEQTAILVEIKNKMGATGPLERAVLKAIQFYNGAIAIMSFNPFSARWFRKNAPSVVCGLVAKDRRDSDKRTSFIKNIVNSMSVMLMIARPDFVAYDIRSVPNKDTELARARGLPLLTWTVRTSEQQILAHRYTDNIIFENLRP